MRQVFQISSVSNIREYQKLHAWTLLHASFFLPKYLDTKVPYGTCQHLTTEDPAAALLKHNTAHQFCHAQCIKCTTHPIGSAWPPALLLLGVSAFQGFLGLKTGMWNLCFLRLSGGSRARSLPDDRGNNLE